MGNELGQRIIDVLRFKTLTDKVKNKIYRNYYNFISAEDFTSKSPERAAKYLINNDSVRVYKLKNMVVAAAEDQTFIMGNQKEILIESSNYRVKSSPDKFINIKSDSCINIDKCCNLALLWNKNYWHFTFEALDKLIAMEESGFNGTYLVFNNYSIKELLRLLDIPESRIAYAEPGMIYKINELHVVEAIIARPGAKTSNCLCSLFDKVAKKINFDDSHRYPKRLYIKRIGSRKIKNEKEFLDVIEKYGFTTIIPEDLSIEEEIKYFRAADIVIIPHGAGSTNAIYMHPNAHIIECFGYRYNNPCILNITNPKKLNYHMLAELVNAPVIKGIKEDFFVNGFSEDMTINLQLLDATLDGIVRNEKLVLEKQV